MNLNQYGWNTYFEKSLNAAMCKNLLPARVISVHGKYNFVLSEDGELITEISGKMRYISSQELLPAVGDFVLIEKLPDENKGIIHKVLPRLTKFSRKAAGPETVEQVLCANFDTVFITMALNNNFNLRRIERYLVMAWESGAQPVIILSKADLCQDVNDKLFQVQGIAPGVDVIAVSSLSKEGLNVVEAYLKPYKTAVLLGSSGVGKSTLINTLMGEDIMKVQEARADDDRGRHTTTSRELLILPNGAMIIDTPGMRELGLWETDGSMDSAFTDIEMLAQNCRFSDCKHKTEPGCAVLSAVNAGTLDKKRYESYQKLQREAIYIESKVNQKLHLEQKKQAKNLSKYTRSIKD